MKGRMRLLASLLCCCMLCGCGGVSFGTQNIEELLRTPRPTARQSAVQTALNTYLGQMPQLKYPRSGTQTEPVLFGDFDGDSSEEAAVLYTVESNDKNVHLAILERSGDEWTVGEEVRGLSTEVVQLEAADFWPGTTQLVIGYANSNLLDKYLEVYDYRDGTLWSVCKQPYEACCIRDFDDNGVPELCAVSTRPDPGAMCLQLFRPGEHLLEAVQVLELDDRLDTCTKMMPTRSGLIQGIVLNGTMSNGTEGSCVFRWQDGNFRRCPQDAPHEALLRSRRTRNLAPLRPSDISGRGTVFVAEAGYPIQTLKSASRFYPVEWKDYLKDVPSVRYGIYDAQFRYFVRLPETWRGRISIAELSDHEWQIIQDDGRFLARVHLVPPEAENGIYYEAAHLDEYKVLIRTGSICTKSETSILVSGVYVLE